MSARPPPPSDVPLTDVMDFTAGDGTCWYAYVEAVPGTDRWPRLRDAHLPARHLRFDSATESRAVAPVPAGAPFLPEVRLRTLLDRSLPIGIPATALHPARDGWERARRAAERAAALGKSGRKHWRRGARWGRALGERVEEAVVLAADRAVAFLTALLRGRRSARP